jgi:hypothetical protein
VSVLGADSIPFHEEAAAGGLEPSSFFLLLPSTEYYSIKNRVLFFAERERERVLAATRDSNHGRRR